MVMVGYRQDATTNETLYLLQNWWAAKPFVEVDLAYLQQAGTQVWFVTTPQKLIPAEFSTNFAPHVEVEIDAPEQLDFEM